MLGKTGMNAPRRAIISSARTIIIQIVSMVNKGSPYVNGLQIY